MSEGFWDHEVALIRAMRPPSRPHVSEARTMRRFLVERMHQWPRAAPANVLSVRERLLSSKETIDATMQAHGVDVGELYRRTGYRPPAPPPGAASARKSAPIKLTFPTPGEFREALERQFRVWRVGYGNHDLAHRCCPVLAMEKVADQEIQRAL